MKFRIVTFVMLLAMSLNIKAANKNVKIEVDVSEVPHLENWAMDAKALMLKWYPRIINLLPTKGQEYAKTVKLKIKKTDEGIAYASGNTVTVCSGWIEKRPEDLGLVVHELVHVLQAYPGGNPGWLTEGIADYIRWAIYEGKTQKDFHKPREKQGYKKGYQISAGFLLWLETEYDPGIIKKLNTQMRKGQYKDELFKQYTKKSLDELWKNYITGNSAG
ncbi:MAG: basic secretory family protein [Lentisphaeraceae bacterium]|nr:basic secretory family protein [Lentisphaeraceae bacterium]